LIPTTNSTPLTFVYELAQRLQMNHEENAQNYFLLLDIYAFVDYYLRTEQIQRAFLVLKQLKLFPYGKDEDEDEQARQLFTSNKLVRTSSLKKIIIIQFRFSFNNYFLIFVLLLFVLIY